MALRGSWVRLRVVQPEVTGITMNAFLRKIGGMCKSSTKRTTLSSALLMFFYATMLHFYFGRKKTGRGRFRVLSVNFSFHFRNHLIGDVVWSRRVMRELHGRRGAARRQ